VTILEVSALAPELVGLLGLLLMIFLLAFGIPVAIAMLVVAVIGYAYIVDPSAALARLGSDAFHGAGIYSLSVVPLFIMMGLVLAQTGLGADVYKLLDKLFWRLSGGLAVATIGASSAFGAVSGSVMASASTMSAVAVPEMRRYRYDDGYAAACTAAGATLGALIPPSALLVLYGVLTEESIGSLLVGGILPGVLTTALLMLAAYLMAKFRPALAPRVHEKPSGSIRKLILGSWAVPAIFGISMGGIYLGVFTPTEAAAVGALLAVVYGALSGRMRWRDFGAAMDMTVKTTGAIFLIVVTGQMFGYFVTISRIPAGLAELINDLTIAPALVMVAVFAIYFFLGALMDEIAIMIIMTPVMYPIVTSLGYDGVWFGVLTIMMLLTGLLTPPVGLLTFVVSGITKIPIGAIFRSITPLVAALAVAIILVILFPEIVLALPNLM
jgi:tripartite ATP-independent transporter DctM subunit